jgi:hypothetical protein
MTITPQTLLITIISYDDEGEADALAAEAAEEHSSLETEVVFGGQPYYHYIISLE